MARITNEELAARIDVVHASVGGMQTKLDTLLEDYYRRKGLKSVALWVLSIFTSVATIVATHYISVFK